jgi:hypothetical protein
MWAIINMKKLLVLLFLTASFSTFAGSQLDFTLSDFCYQQPNVQDRGGVYYFPNEEVGITDSSLCVYKDLYDQYMSKVNLKNGRFDGKFIRWWENGQKHQEKNYNDGKKDGKWIEWGITGKIIRESKWKDGECISGDWCPVEQESAEQRAQDEAKAKEATKQELEAKLEALKAAKKQELAEEKFEDEQNVRALIEEIQAEEDADRRQVLEDILSQLKVNYIGLIAARVKSFWRYQGHEDDWGCDVRIIQSEAGDVLAVNIQECTIDNSDKAISFKNSIERAVYKASPLPIAPDKDLFDAEILFHFRVN